MTSGSGRVLLDTSVVIDLATGRLDDLPGRPLSRSVSGVTLAGLHHGVLVAGPEQLASRIATLYFVRDTCPCLPVDEGVAMIYGQVAADTRRKLGRRLKLADGLIAATAMANGLKLLTRDRAFAEVPGLRVEVI